MDQSTLRQLLATSPNLTLPQALRQLLETSIVSGEMKAGDRINENALAANLEVNRATIRETLTALAEDGLVEFIRNRGAFVRSVGLQDALHLYDVRGGLARTAGRLLAVRITSSELRQLDELHQELVRASDLENVKVYDELNIAFHNALIGYARNPHLARMEEKVSRDIRIYLREGVMAPQTLRISSKEHAAILDAVRTSDADKAGAAFEIHVLNGKQRMLENIGLRNLATQDTGSRSSMFD
jgi:DNA-binding GntR family transcriptional regulator